MPTVRQLSKQFKSVGGPPEPLVAFVEFAGIPRLDLSGCFELRFDDALKHWFSNHPDAAKRFASFGANADGGIYAYWLHDGVGIDKAPVVYLGSEGGGAVLADTTLDFLRLLAVGADELGPDVMRGSIDPPEEPAAELDRFRDWLKAKFKLSKPRDPMKLVGEAQDAHPSLPDWLDALHGTPAAPAGPGTTAAKWDEVDTLKHLFGAADKSPQLTAFLDQLGTARLAAEGLARDYRCREKGIEVNLRYDGTTRLFQVVGFFLFAEGVEKCKAYPGVLPGGVRMTDTRSRVVGRLGEGISGRPAGFDVKTFGPRDDYAFDGFSLTFDYKKGKGEVLELVAVGPT